MGLLHDAAADLAASWASSAASGPTPRNLAPMAENIPGGADGPNAWGVIGISRDQWMLVGAALTLGGNVRVGLEDNFYLPDGDDGALQRRPHRQGAPDGAGRRPAPGDGGRGARACSACPSARWPRAGVSLPLEGVPVLDLSRLLPGGFCSLLLADFGAEVLKVEDTGMGDYVRWAPPYYEGAEDSAESRAVPGAEPQQALDPHRTSRTTAGARSACAWRASTTCVLESFRPGVLDRLGVGYERLREENPGLVYCAITGYGQDGPLRDRSGHDMNYLGLIGLLGLTGERRRPAGAGGGPDRRPRRRRADGRLRDPGRAARARPLGRGPVRRRLDGRRRAVLAGDGRRRATSPTASRRTAATLELAGALVCYRPYACADGWVTLGALEPKFWAAWCRGVGREDLIEKQFEAPGLATPTPRSRGSSWSARASEWQAFAVRARLLPGAGARPRRGARLRARARARDGRRARPAGRRAPVRQLGAPIKLSRTPGRARAARARRSASTPTTCCAAAGYSERGDRRAEGGRRRRRARRPASRGRFMA